MTSQRSALFFTPLRHTFDDLCASVARQRWMEVERGEGSCHWRGRGLSLSMDLAGSPEEARERIQAHYYNLVVLDCRHLPHLEADCERQETALHAFLDLLSAERDRERWYPFHRIVVLVGDENEERVDRLIFAMGERHVGACLRDLSLSPRLIGRHARAARDRLIEQLWSYCHRTLVERRHGKKALSAAGGGITGIYYELGVLKCLEDALDVGLGAFDLYFGISAGAVVAACLANGFHIDEMIANVRAHDTGWAEQLRLPWRHLNVGELPRRFLAAQQEVAVYLVQLLRRRTDFSLSSIVGSYETLLAPMFDNVPVERFLAELFSQEGRTNNFRELVARLFVGATDQDRREHVLFGDEGAPEVTISKALQASTAAHPYFRSVEVDGRYYTDGMLTRTSNLSAAIRHGADLVFILDPFLPMIADEPGTHSRHGSLWLFEQDLKTLAYTRFEQVSREILRHHPDVNAYTFVPSKRMRRLMGQNPFAGRNFNAIACEAYRSTYRRLESLEYKMAGELASHGIELDLGPVRETVARLEAAGRPDALLLLEPEARERYMNGSAA